MTPSAISIFSSPRKFAAWPSRKARSAGRSSSIRWPTISFLCPSLRSSTGRRRSRQPGGNGLTSTVLHAKLARWQGSQRHETTRTKQACRCCSLRALHHCEHRVNACREAQSMLQAKQLLEDAAAPFRIRLPFRCFHELTHEEGEQLLITRAVALDFSRMALDDFPR